MSYIEYARLLYKKAQEMGLHPQWLTDYGLFSITVGDKIGFVAFTYSMLNSHLGMYLARNKHATRVVLDLFHFPTIPYALPETNREANEFLKTHKKIVAKPTQGTGSNDVHIITSEKDIEGLLLENYIFEKFIDGREVRYFIFKNEVIGVYEKHDSGPLGVPDEQKRISFPKEQWDNRLVKLALAISEKMYLKMAAVDFLLSDDGNVSVLEVNSAPGILFVQKPSVGPAVDIAKLFLEELVTDIKKFKR